MRLKSIKLFAFVMLLNTLSAVPSLADTRLFLSTAHTIISDGLESITTLLTVESYLTKRGQPYDAPNDPAFKSRAGGPEEGPKHGYFAVPLIVIGLAGIVLYFSRLD